MPLDHLVKYEGRSGIQQVSDAISAVRDQFGEEKNQEISIAIKEGKGLPLSTTVKYTIISGAILALLGGCAVDAYNHFQTDQDLYQN